MSGVHPPIFAGFNDWAINYGPFNDAGVNGIVWVDTFDGEAVSNILVANVPYMPHADLCVKAENRTLKVRVEKLVLCAGGD